MQRLGSWMSFAGLFFIAVGLLGLLSIGLQRLGVPFVFPVSPWYGPFLGGLTISAIGWFLRRSTGLSNQSQS